MPRLSSGMYDPFIQASFLNFSFVRSPGGKSGVFGKVLRSAFPQVPIFFFNNSSYIPYIFHVTSIFIFFFWFVSLLHFHLCPPILSFSYLFFFCLHGEVGGWVGADGGWRLGFLLTRLCGFITRRKGGNTMIHFTVSV